ncbi:MAG: hypothetical protein KAX37_00385 [Opitutaceae bacterium]|jgi:hypothetical protein|nr:hypothetical protein [Opitutaceae bacterium]
MVYFRNSGHGARHLDAFRKFARLWESDRKVVREAFSTQPGETSSILHMTTAEMPFRARLSFLSVLTKKRGGVSRVTELPEGNPYLAAAFFEYERQLKAKLCERGFIRFLETYDPSRVAPAPAAPGPPRL